MTFDGETLSLDETVFTLLRDAIHERTGLFFDTRRRETLAEKLSPLAIERGMSSFIDYYYYLRYDLEQEAEWARVMDALSVPETYFWREMDQVTALTQVLMPQLLAAQPDQTVRIWSAACASGEEPLSIAMALNEAGWFDRVRIEIYASDASPKAIARARQGIYRERAFRSLPLYLREKYFEERGSSWAVAPELQEKVTWLVANVASAEDVSHLASVPIVFCRNVFIYFSEGAIRKTVHYFFERMPSPGYLFVGASESLFRISSEFELEEVAGAFVYVKR